MVIPDVNINWLHVADFPGFITLRYINRFWVRGDEILICHTNDVTSGYGIIKCVTKNIVLLG
jgi:hypothetical protein